MLFVLKREYNSVCLLLVLLIMATACQKQPSIALHDSAPSAIWFEKTVTFSDPALGLILDLPSDWTITPRFQNPADIGPMDAFYSPCVNRTPDVLPPCTKIQISRYSSAQSWDEVRKLSEKKSPSTTILEQREIDLNGLPALWSKLEDKSLGQHPMIHVLILVDNSVVIFNVYGKLDPAEDVLTSIRAIK